MSFIQTMRWFGPQDPVSLMDIRQSGCTGIVTALHQIPVGNVWSKSAIQERIDLIEAANDRFVPLHWSVVESLPVHESIKKGFAERDEIIQNYIESMQNLAACGVHTICYNFMPVLDWSRTDLQYTMTDGSKALHFVWADFALFDLHILKRPNAAQDYDAAITAAANAKYLGMTQAEKDHLAKTVLLGLPGSEETFELSNFQAVLDEYKHISAETLKQNLFYFIQKVGPAAEQLGVRLCIHPDDPPFPLLGLPRILSTEQDVKDLYEAFPHRANGLTFCTGSLGVRADNDLVSIIEKYGDRIHFVHLRSTKREDHPRNFYEADHLTGDVDMYAVVKALTLEAQKRKADGRTDVNIPMRPDHGHQMLDDLTKESKAYPGYTAIGRLKGLAELRGLEYGIERSLAE